MSSVTRVPETTTAAHELDAGNAWSTIKSQRWKLLVPAFVRFRYGDGFSHSRALGIQLSLALIPLAIALVGLSETLYAERMGTVLRLTLLQLSPGTSDDMMGEALDRPPQGDGDSGEVALWFGLIVAIVTMTSAVGQIERGANRIYGIQRDRPTVQKYGRAFVLAVTSAFPALAGFLVLISSASFGEAVEQVYGIDDDLVALIAVPLGIALLLVSITALLRFPPRRRQPGWSWLALGAATALLLWLLFTALVGAYLKFSDNLGTIYGPLTGIMVLLLWAQLSSIAIFLGLAISAQVEAEYAGVHRGAVDDPEEKVDSGRHAIPQFGWWTAEKLAATRVMALRQARRWIEARIGPATATPPPRRKVSIVREISVPASFAVDEHDNVVRSVFDHDRDDPDHVIFQRLVDGAWTDVTCRQAAGEIRSAALGLIAKGVNPGDRVALLSATRYEWPILDFAILAVGALTVPIYETSSAEQVRFVLADSEAVLIVAETDAHADRIDHLVEELPGLREVLRIDGAAPALAALAEAGKSRDAAELDDQLAAIKSSDPATLIYTSGTTGRPKGCQLTHSNLVYEIRGAKACFPNLLDAGERMLVFLPLAHVLARAITIAAFVNKVTLGFTSDVKNLVPTLAVFRPTLVVSVPRVFEKVYNTAEQNARNDGKGRIFALAADTAIEWSKAADAGRGREERKGKGAGWLLRTKHALFDRLVYGKLRAALGGECRGAISGGAALGARLGHFYRGVGLTIYEGYGLTETSAAITVNRVDDVRIGSVGKLLPGNSMRLGDDDELLVSGGVVFSGYWHNDEETDAVFTHGWFHTGDLGAIDDDGFLTIVGRKKEIIVTAGGKNVAPAILEDRLRAHPLISQAMAVGDGKPFIAALITIDPEAIDGWKERNGKSSGASVGDLATDPDLVAEIDLAVKEANQAVSRAEAIRKFAILAADFTEDSGELTPTMKVKRKVVAQKFASDIEALYGPR